MPAKGKGKQQPTAGQRTAEQQYEMGYRIWTDIENEANTRVAEWVKRDGNKNTKEYRQPSEALKPTPTGTSRQRRKVWKGHRWKRCEAREYMS